MSPENKNMKKKENVGITKLEAKFLNLPVVDEEICKLTKEGLDSTAITNEMFKPLSTPRWVRRRQKKLKMEGRI